MNNLQLEKKCDICSFGKVTLDNIEFLRFYIDSFNKSTEQQKYICISEFKRKLDIAVESFELYSGICKECSGTGMVITEDGKKILDFVKRNTK